MTTDVPAHRMARVLAAGACAVLLVAGCSSDAPGEVDADATVEGVPTPPPETDALAPPTENT